MSALDNSVNHLYLTVYINSMAIHIYVRQRYISCMSTCSSLL